MTSEEWERCTDPIPLLDFLRGKASDRTLRLFACACVRRVWDLLVEEGSRAALAIAERHADALAGAEELSTACAAAAHAVRALDRPTPGDAAAPFARQCAAHAARDAASPFRWAGAMAGYPDSWAADAVAWAAVGRASAPGASAAGPPVWAAVRVGERAAQAALLRCLLGNPFKPAPTIPPEVRAWSGGALRRLTEAIAEERRFGDLPVLADLLEEAGVTDAELLGHLRGPGPHALGCHALDAVFRSGSGVRV